jgi:hypothetical protein
VVSYPTQESKMQDKTKIVAILDRSGSMKSIISDAIGGYNTFLEEQKKNSKPADLTVILFDDKYEKFYSGALPQAPKMDKDSYVPRGSTALLDAMGRTIDDVGRELANLSEDQRPNKVLFIIITDGEENASTKYTSKQISDMVSRQRDMYKWEFIFLAANLDAIASASMIGIQAQNAVNFVSNAASVKGSYGLVSEAICNYRNSGEIGNLNVDVDSNGTVVSRVDGSSGSGN